MMHVGDTMSTSGYHEYIFEVLYWLKLNTIFEVIRYETKFNILKQTLNPSSQITLKCLQEAQNILYL